MISTPQPPAPPVARIPSGYVAPPPLAAPPVVAPRSMIAPSASLQPPPQAENEDEVEELPQARSGWFLGCLILSLLACVGLGITAVVVFAIWLSDSLAKQRVSDAEQASEQQQAAEKLARLDLTGWTDASKKTINFAGATVHIESVALGEPRFQSKAEILQTGEIYLIIDLTVRNDSRPEILYKSWYSYKYEEGAETVMAELIDDAGEKFELFPIPGADRVERHVRSEHYIEKNNSISDTLIFKLPPNYKFNAEQGFKLRLPAAAMEDHGFFRFRIPGHMVVDREVMSVEEVISE